MAIFMQGNTESLHLSHDMLLPSGSTFDVKLVANVGEKVYSVARFYEFAMSGSRDFFKITNSKSKSFIELVTIVGVNYATGCEVNLYANKDSGEQILVKQQFLYKTFEEANDALSDIYSFYSRNPNGDWILKKYSGVKYRYTLNFLVKPNDILMRKGICYLVKGIVVLIYNSIVNICYDSIDDFCEDELKNCTKYDYYTVKNEYNIEQL